MLEKGSGNTRATRLDVGQLAAAAAAAAVSSCGARQDTRRTAGSDTRGTPRRWTTTTMAQRRGRAGCTGARAKGHGRCSAMSGLRGSAGCGAARAERSEAVGFWASRQSGMKQQRRGEACAQQGGARWGAAGSGVARRGCRRSKAA